MPTGCSPDESLLFQQICKRTCLSQAACSLTWRKGKADRMCSCTEHGFAGQWSCSSDLRQSRRCSPLPWNQLEYQHVMVLDLQKMLPTTNYQFLFSFSSLPYLSPFLPPPLFLSTTSLISELAWAQRTSQSTTIKFQLHQVRLLLLIMHDFLLGFLLPVAFFFFFFFSLLVLNIWCQPSPVWHIYGLMVLWLKLLIRPW